MAKTLIPVLFVLTICQANFLFGQVIGPQANDSDEISYRLPKDIVPSYYNLSLNVDLEKFTFTGTVDIKIKANKATDKVILNAKNLNITEATLTDNKSAKPVVVLGFDGPNKQEFLIVKVKSEIQKGIEYVLSINYTGELNDQKRGFYRSRYITDKNTVNYVAATHFEPTGARLAFPCWDEPEYKAVFNISITNKKSYTAISNMPAKHETPEKEPGTQKTTVFKETPPMSTYLVAFVVSDYGHTNNTADTFRVWTKPHAVNQTKYALETGEKLLSKLSEYTNIDYHEYMPKMDQVTLKDFSPSAMENWGLVTYRESALLFEDNVTPIRSKQSITTIIAHEFAHQWFGNLVSPKWWTYVWLNEGFANYFQYYITHQILPGWRLNETFVVDNMQGNAFVADAADDVRPMNKEVDTPQEISDLFDSIAYQKAGSVIRMMSHILTEEVFQKGLRQYLKAKKLSVADSKDLLDILNTAANKKWEDKTFVEIMDPWVNKPGYPVVNVKNTNGKLEITQERFTLYSRKNDKDWWIPLTYVTESDKPNFGNTSVSMWLKPGNASVTIDHKEGDKKWIIFNNLQTGYYRVNYDEGNWKLLAKYLSSNKYNKIHVINRAQLIDDSLNLARSNRLSYTTALSLTLYLKQETDYVPWQTTFRNLNFLQKMLGTSDEFKTFKMYVKYIMTNLMKDVNYEPKEKDEDLPKLLKTNAMKWACRADVAACTNYVNKKYKEWANNQETKLDVDMKTNILCAGIRSANESSFNTTMNHIKSIQDEDERKSLLPILACSDSSERWKPFLLTSLENTTLLPFNSAVQSVISEHPESVDIVLNILEDKYNQIKALTNSDDVIKSCVSAISGVPLTSEQFTTLSKFMSKELKPDLLQTTIQTATRNMEWAQAHRKSIEKWLVANKETFNSASSLTFTSLLLLLSIFVTRYY